MSTPPQTPPARPEPGTRVQFRWRKWDGGTHWVHDCVYLGSDRWGDWFGQRAGLAQHPPRARLPRRCRQRHPHAAER